MPVVTATDTVGSSASQNYAVTIVPGAFSQYVVTVGGSSPVPAGSGFLVETAVTIHDGTAFVFGSQNPSGAGADPRADRTAFRNFLGGIRLSR